MKQGLEWNTQTNQQKTRANPKQSNQRATTTWMKSRGKVQICTWVGKSSGDTGGLPSLISFYYVGSSECGEPGGQLNKLKCFKISWLFRQGASRLQIAWSMHHYVRFSFVCSKCIATQTMCYICSVQCRSAGFEPSFKHQQTILSRLWSTIHWPSLLIINQCCPLSLAITNHPTTNYHSY